MKGILSKLDLGGSGLTFLRLASILVFGVLAVNVQASNFDLVAHHSGADGSVRIYVAQMGTSSEQWKFEVEDLVGDRITLRWSANSQQMQIGAEDWVGSMVVTGGSPAGFVEFVGGEANGMQVHTSGAVYNQPPTNPDWPPYHPQAVGKGGEQIQIMGCAGAALTAIGTYITGGGLIRSVRAGLMRGTLAGGPAGAGISVAVSTMLGASLTMLDACAQQ